ncbi:MAG: hypothetical protein M3340_16265 [Actinomycetota bacterium]|nr:hypothetical protein [Actinomycetota bacterium]
MAKSDRFEPVDTRRARGAWRLTFRFDGSDVQLARSERVDMIAPASPSAPPRSGEKRSGAWLDLKGPGGRTVFHRPLRDPFQTRAEVHSPDGQIRVVFRPPEPCEFQALLPYLPDATTVVLWSSPPEPALAGEPAREQARFELEEEKKPPDEPPRKAR